MNKDKLLMVALLLISACDASAQREPNPDFKRVFESISAKNALSVPYRAHIKRMSPLCEERAESDPEFNSMGNVRCLQRTDVRQLSLVDIVGPAVSMINARIAGLDKCAYMRSTLIQLYGKPAENRGACGGSWVVRRGKGKPIVHVLLEEDTQENIIYFSNQEEQGP